MKISFPVSGLLAAASLIVPLFPGKVCGEGSLLGAADALLQVQSAPAVSVAEKVRANRPGTVVELFVKVGDTVKKGQMLGHTELYSAKLAKDLAEANVDKNTSVEEKFWQLRVWTIQREDTEEAVRKRQAPKSRLDWALAMEKIQQAQYDGQLQAKETQKRQYEYAVDEYEGRIFRAPVDGVVSEVPVELGKGVNYATHVATIKNDNLLIVPVTLPAALAEASAQVGTILVRTPNGKAMIPAVVDSMTDDPAAPKERKIARLFINKAELSSAPGQKPEGMKFDVFVPNDPAAR